jgi:hypothetical protein
MTRLGFAAALLHLVLVDCDRAIAAPDAYFHETYLDLDVEKTAEQSQGNETGSAGAPAETRVHLWTPLGEGPHVLRLPLHIRHFQVGTILPDAWCESGELELAGKH